MDDLIINVCPTGMIPTRQASPNVPITPLEIAEDVRRCYEAGASIAHLHARDEAEEPTWNPRIYEDLIGEVRLRCPEIIVCATTSGRNWGDVERRAAVLDLQGSVKPEMASLTLGSMNFPTGASVNPPEVIEELLARMIEREIKPEFEIFDLGMAHYVHGLLKNNSQLAPSYFNVIVGSKGTVDLSPLSVASIVASLPKDAVWAMGGIGRFQLRANAVGIAFGGHVRVGLEDNPFFDWSSRAPASNPKLVERVVRLASELGRPLATPHSTRKKLDIPNVPVPD